MNASELKSSIVQTSPPAGLNIYQQSLWHDAKGNWQKAHELIQDLDDKNAAWIHAYLHRKEGDIGNANYWYRRAGRTMPSIPLDEEWTNLVEEL